MKESNVVFLKHKLKKLSEAYAPREKCESRVYLFLWACKTKQGSLGCLTKVSIFLLLLFSVIVFFW